MQPYSMLATQITVVICDLTSKHGKQLLCLSAYKYEIFMCKLRCNYYYSFDECHTSTLYTNSYTIQNTQLFLKSRITRKMRGKKELSSKE
jgi:hypothetical protein